MIFPEVLLVDCWLTRDCSFGGADMAAFLYYNPRRPDWSYEYVVFVSHVGNLIES